MATSTTAGKHLTLAEQELVDKTIRQDKGTPMDAWRAVGRGRERRGGNPIHKSAVYRYLAGDTHLRGKKEKRGRKRIRSSADAKKLDRTRHRLIGEADNEWPVKHADIAQESGFEGRACPRVIADALRARGG